MPGISGIPLVCFSHCAVLHSQAVSAAAEKEDIKKRWDALYNEFFVVLGYLPLTIHWCVLLLHLRPPRSLVLDAMLCVLRAASEPYAHFVAMQFVRMAAALDVSCLREFGLGFMRY